jgi:hypothetical protein
MNDADFDRIAKISLLQIGHDGSLPLPVALRLG